MPMKNLTYLFFILLFLGCQNKLPATLTDSCKRLNNLIQNKGSDTTALTNDLEKALTIAEKQSDRQHDSLISVVCRLKGIALANQNKYAEARVFYEKGLRIGRRHLPVTENIIIRHYRNMGVSYYNANDYQNALRYYDSVQVIRNDEVSLGFKIENLSQSAICYRELKDLVSSESMASEACTLAEPFYPKPDLAVLYMNYATILRAAKKYQASIDIAQKAVNILTSLSKEKKLTQFDSTNLAHSYFYMAFALKDSGEFTAAFPYYIQAIQLYKQVGNLKNQVTGLMNLSNAYRLNKQYDKAEQGIQEALRLLNQSPTLSDFLKVRKGELFVGLNEILMDKKEYVKALIVQDSAITHLTRYGESANLNHLLLNHRYNLLATYTDKAKAHIALAENGKDTEGYQKALKLTQQLIDLADDIRADYFSDDAKLTLANDIKPALEKAIGLCHQLFQKTQDTTYLHKAFAFVEYSRSMVLYENARLDNQLPPDLKAENDNLKKLEAALIAKNNVEELQNYLRLKRQFREKIKSLNRNTLASITALQTELLKDGQTAFIEFFVGDSAIFVFKLLHNGLILNKIAKPKDLEQQIETLRNGITQKKPVDDATVFVQQSARLYALLFPENAENMRNTEGGDVTKWIIAPDGVLSYLPFELLTRSKGTVSDFRKVDFLLHHYQISYAYSANLLWAQKRIKKSRASQLYAGFASKYENKDTNNIIADASREVLSRQNVYELARTKEEVNTIQAIIGGKTFVDEAATEEVFKHEASQYKILHFAMHSLTDNSDPAQSKLLFSLVLKDTTEDNDLTAAELYTMRLNADLAVLSACNTGFGTLAKGEGVMSLARAFTYAGVPATVMSLWKAPDATTPDIMVDFYKNLKKGMTKDAALREAKLTYLNKSYDSKDANPFFWAGFVPIGNMETLDMADDHPLSKMGIWVGLLLASGFGIWFWLKKRQNLSSQR